MKLCRNRYKPDGDLQGCVVVVPCTGATAGQRVIRGCEGMFTDINGKFYFL